MYTKRELAEQLGEIARKMRPSVARGAMHAAQRMLQDFETQKPLSEDEVRLLMDGTKRGQEYAVYMEDRGYPMLQAVIVDSTYGDTLRVIYSNGMKYMLEMKDYNRTWRLWGKCPSGVERKLHKWRARK